MRVNYNKIKSAVKQVLRTVLKNQYKDFKLREPQLSPDSPQLLTFHNDYSLIIREIVIKIAGSLSWKKSVTEENLEQQINITLDNYIRENPCLKTYLKSKR